VCKASSNKLEKVLSGRLDFPLMPSSDAWVPINSDALPSVAFWERCSQVLATPFFCEVLRCFYWFPFPSVSDRCGFSWGAIWTHSENATAFKS
jgi:hypothetical protein